jgi:prolyl oligopeptidase
MSAYVLVDQPRASVGPLLLLLVGFHAAPSCYASDEDPYLWLEEVEGEQALDWAKERSRKDTAVLEAVPEFDQLYAEFIDMYNSEDRIPEPTFLGERIYNYWQDKEHERGIWRRTALTDFTSDEVKWETVLDLDELADAEGENWVWKGADCLKPENRHCIIYLSRGGADATVVREFDTTTKTFVAEGFELPEAKNFTSWKDVDTIWVGTDFGEESLTASGYPRITKEWKRGDSLEQAEIIIEGSHEDVFAFAYSIHTPEKRYDIVSVVPEFFRETTYMLLGGRKVKLDFPSDAKLEGFFRDHLLVSLRSPWKPGETEYSEGSLIAIGVDKFLAGSREFKVIFSPAERTSLNQVSDGFPVRTLHIAGKYVLYTTLDNVRGRLYRVSLTDGDWEKSEIELPGFGAVSIGSASDSSGDFFFTYTDFLTPSSLYLVRDGHGPSQVKSTPAWFDATGMDVAQHEAVSKDGTRIPYFLVTPEGYQADGSNPTLINAYGGFEVSRLPSYNGTVGKAWLSRGGVFVLANIRGGGEFGPKWHQGAVKENHQNNFDDLIAVAEDLVDRKVTSPSRLGIIGGSQGGLLVGGSFVQRPDLFNAVVSAVPLFDMKRFNKLLAGASWMAEYGNPDTDDWEYMKLWSPYQNLDKNADYPEVFFLTNTRDDRVHPAHARKAVAKMTDMGHTVYYYENTEGGHASGANLNSMAYTRALTYAYLWMKLRD